MNSRDRFEASPAWCNNSYNLPLCPGLNNPWLYCAYADLIMRRADDQSIRPMEAEAHFLKCEKEPGLFYRWPGGSDQTSHDEILGAATLSPWIAKRILAYLDQHDGEFNVTGEAEDIPERYNVYRMMFLRPYLLRCAGFRVSLLSQLQWSLCLIFDGFTRKQVDAGGALRFWLMSSKMASLPLCSLAFILWRLKVQKMMTPKSCLAIEPKEFPIYSELAPETW